MTYCNALDKYYLVNNAYNLVVKFQPEDIHITIRCYVQMIPLFLENMFLVTIL